ncbi:unnamed protein product [Owenia fusiformis]|uniref:Uncharacterized protein n=1 Tax=Owenia fusiformis TaxID=6347 RepID=A0A8S4PH80_OWEFU|nr:unnamed protein product [Owenia fusiformis]
MQLVSHIDTRETITSTKYIILMESWCIQRYSKLAEEELKRQETEEQFLIDEMEVISNNRKVKKLQRASEDCRQEIQSLKQIVVQCRREKLALDQCISVVSCKVRHQKLEHGHCYCESCRDKSAVIDLSKYKRGSCHFPTIEEVRYNISYQ